MGENGVPGEDRQIHGINMTEDIPQQVRRVPPRTAFYEALPAKFVYHEARYPERAQPLWPCRTTENDAYSEANDADRLLLHDLKQQLADPTVQLIHAMDHKVPLGLAHEYVAPEDNKAKMSKAILKIQGYFEQKSEGYEAPLFTFARGVLALGRTAINIPNPFSPITRDRIRAFDAYLDLSHITGSINRALLETLADNPDRTTFTPQEWAEKSQEDLKHPDDFLRDFVEGYGIESDEFFRKAAGFTIEHLAGPEGSVNPGPVFGYYDRWFTLPKITAESLTVQSLDVVCALGKTASDGSVLFVPIVPGDIYDHHGKLRFEAALPGNNMRNVILGSEGPLGDSLRMDEKGLTYIDAPDLQVEPQDGLRVLNVNSARLVVSTVT